MTAEASALLAALSTLAFLGELDKNCPQLKDKGPPWAGRGWWTFSTHAPARATLP